MAALHITKDNFDKEVLQAEGTVLMDFWAPWCGPCKMLLPVIEKLADTVTSAKICKVNVDEQPELASQFGVMMIPTLVVMKDGRVVTSSPGVKREDARLKMLEV